MIQCNEKTWTWLWWGLVVSLLASTYQLKPIVDPDFFWHLHHGQWLWENGTLPSADPFALEPAPEVTPRQHYLLTSYWLAQLSYYGIYALSGWSGFFALRWALLLVMIWAVMARRHAATLLHALCASSLLLVIFARFPVERPQFYSIVAFAVLLALLDRLQSREDAPDYAAWLGIPALMLVWGNLHGGVLLGQILCGMHLLILIFSADTVKVPVKRRGLVLGVAILLSLASPSGFHHASVMLVSSGEQYADLYSTIREYDHIGTAIFTRKIWSYLIFPALTMLAFLGLLKSGWRRNLPHLLLLAAFAAAAFGSVRYLPFLGLLALPHAGEALAAWHRSYTVPLLLGVCLLCALASPMNLTNMRRLYVEGPVSSMYPAGAVNYLREQGLRGRVLNNFIWGGYLRFMLGGGQEMLVDGRTLDADRYGDYLTLLGLQGGEGDVKVFREILAKYQFDYVILPKFSQGQPLWLNLVLSRLPGWRLGYDDGQVVVFYRQR